MWNHLEPGRKSQRRLVIHQHSPSDAFSESTLPRPSRAIAFVRVSAALRSVASRCINLRSGRHAPQAWGFILIAKRVVPSSSTSADVVARSTIWLSMKTRCWRQAQLLLFVARCIATSFSTVWIIMSTTDTRIPCVIFEATSPSASACGCVACSGLFICAAGGARVADLGNLVFDPLERSGRARCRVVGGGVLGLDEGDVVLPCWRWQTCAPGFIL